MLRALYYRDGMTEAEKLRLRYNFFEERAGYFQVIISRLSSFSQAAPLQQTFFPQISLKSVLIKLKSREKADPVISHVIVCYSLEHVWNVINLDVLCFVYINPWTNIKLADTFFHHSQKNSRNNLFDSVLRRPKCGPFFFFSFLFISYITMIYLVISFRIKYFHEIELRNRLKL